MVGLDILSRTVPCPCAEGALLQTFPHDYSFIPKDEAVQIAPLARLIGNAVPVRLGEAIGASIVTHIGNALG